MLAIAAAGSASAAPCSRAWKAGMAKAAGSCPAALLVSGAPRPPWDRLCPLAGQRDQKTPWPTPPSMNIEERKLVAACTWRWVETCSVRVMVT